MSANWKKYLKWIGIALLLYIIWRIINNRMESPKMPTQQVIVPGSGTTTPVQVKFKYTPALVDRKKPFGAGSNNSQEVGYLQTWLNTYYSAGLVVDGDFGPLTASKLTLAKPTAAAVSAGLTSTTLDGLGI